MTTHLADSAAGPSTEYPTAEGYPRVRQPRIVQTVPRRYLAIDGTTPAGGPEFEAAMSALYGTAYSLMYLVRERGIDAHAGPSEALWRRRDGTDGWTVGTQASDPTTWGWTLLLPIPDGADEADIAAALEAARERRPSPAMNRIRVLELEEGLIVEAMHVGPYASEEETLEAMRRLAEEHELVPCGSHHEVYLGDPRRTAPESLRTVLRQPVRPRTH